MNKAVKKRAEKQSERAICIYCSKRKTLSKLIAIEKENKKSKPLYLCANGCENLLGFKFRIAREKKAYKSI